MVDHNLVMELEKSGMEYKNAFRVSFLMEVEGLTKKEAIKKVTREVEEAEQAAQVTMKTEENLKPMDPVEPTKDQKVKKKSIG